MAQDTALKAANARIKQLEASLEQATKQLELTRKSKYKLPSGGGRRGRPSSSFVRVVIPDTHGCYVDKPAIKAFLDDIEQIGPAEVVWLGDHVDCGGFLAQHHTLSYVAQAKYTYEEDCDAANQLLDEVQERCPGARMHYLAGNHERRVEQWIVQQTLRNPADASFLNRAFGIDATLGLTKRKIQYYPQGETIGTATVPGVLRLGKCCFTHGTYCSVNSAKAHCDAYSCNLVFGHIHRADSYARRTIDETFGAWCPGCLCVQQPYYAHSRQTSHVHGYIVQGVQSSGDFITLTVPIINGKSYLGPLAGAIAG